MFIITKLNLITCWQGVYHHQVESYYVLAGCLSSPSGILLRVGRVFIITKLNLFTALVEVFSEENVSGEFITYKWNKIHFRLNCS